MNMMSLLHYMNYKKLLKQKLKKQEYKKLTKKENYVHFNQIVMQKIIIRNG